MFNQILHVLTASPEHAQVLIKAAVSSGFRETGAINLIPSHNTREGLLPPHPIVAIRTAGVAFESLLGFETMSCQRALLTTRHGIAAMVDIAVERSIENASRRSRFEDTLFDLLQRAEGRRARADAWEDPEERRKRMRMEGLQRQQQLKMAIRPKPAKDDGDGNGDGNDNE